MPRHEWTQSEDLIISANYAEKGRKATADLLGMRSSMVGGRARRLGLVEKESGRPKSKQRRPRKARTCTHCSAVFQPATRYQVCCSLPCRQARRAEGIRAERAIRFPEKTPRAKAEAKPSGFRQVSLNEAFRWARENGLMEWDISAVHALRRKKKLPAFQIMRGPLTSGIRIYAMKAAA